VETGVCEVGGIRGTAGMGRELSVGDTGEIVVQSFQGDVMRQRLSLRKNMGRKNVEVLHYKESIKFYSVKKKGKWDVAVKRLEEGVNLQALQWLKVGKVQASFIRLLAR
jgi:hypothetical protein